MSIFDRDLVRRINTGKCFAIIGSGPSCEIGAPSWQELTNSSIKYFQKEFSSTEINDLQEKLLNKNYPYIFERISNKVGLETLLLYIKTQIQNKSKVGHIYNFVTAWPFSNYLTTNYDNFLIEYLDKKRANFLLKKNTKDDIKIIRADTKGFVFKLHGECDDSKNIVLTESQYNDFINGVNREYWREKLYSTLNMVDFVIIGYSVSDPDFSQQLERAKKIASPEHPIFMFATGFTNETIKDYYQKYNIRIISYSNTQGDHSELVKLLKRYNPFIAHRNSTNVGIKPIDENEVSIAASMYIFSKVRLDDDELYINKIFSSLIIYYLKKYFDNCIVSVNILSNKIELEKFFNSKIDPVTFNKAIEYLINKGLVKRHAENSIQINPLGVQTIEQININREILIEKFNKACYLFLKINYNFLSEDQISKIQIALRKGLINAFEKRGLEIANSIFSNVTVDVSDATDILDLINKSGYELEEKIRASYADLMIEVLLNPDDIMKEYLAALTQGYFSYHALSLDPSCYHHRLELARGKNWIIDSSVILPYIAIDSLNHQYAKDLLQKMKGLNLPIKTTVNLLIEVHDHLSWAIKNIKTLLENPQELIEVAKGGFGYKQNLFISGFVNWSSSQGNPLFENYIKACIGDNEEKPLIDRISEKINNEINDVIDFERLTDVDKDMIENLDLYMKQIEVQRRSNQTFRSEHQCKSEAEVILLNKYMNSMFISQSILLNRILQDGHNICWTPEAMYRFISLFSEKPPLEKLLHECLTQDFFYAGFDVINKDNVQKFLNPLIQQSKLKLKTESKNYENVIGKKRWHDLLESYEKMDDIEKPFYSSQIAYYIANQSLNETKVLRKFVDDLNKSSKLDDKERLEYIKLKTKQDQKRKKVKKRISKKKKKKR
ncbi:MAG: SIR2 family protein [Melioribacteraceae bacterium]|nr:SIR2 family protein [Melioribacteraceae bacterium]